MKYALIFAFIGLTIGCTTTKKASTTPTLNGVWTAVRGEAGGQELPSAALENAKVTFADTSYTRVDPSGIGKGVIKYGNNKMDIYEKEGALAGKHTKGIYKFENQQLIICYDLAENTGDNYPATFETKSKPTLRLLVLKR
jgi:uncharacterized protein (TIGR03067 family)